jgi:hypothetical protein
VDGAVIGGSSAAAITGTTITATGDVTIPDKIIHAGDTNTSIRFPAADTVTIETAGAERLRVDSSGNVGVGTASPAVRLEASGGIADVIAGTAQVIARSGDNTNFNQIRVRATATESRLESLAAGTGTSSPLVIHTGGSERMRIDTSGNLLVGGTSNPYAAGGRGIVQSNGTTTAMFGLAVNSVAAGFWISNGSQTTFGAPSGHPILFDINGERVRIDASGNVGIGTSSPTAAKLVVTTGDTAQTAQFQGATGRVRVRGYQDATNGGIIDSTNTAENAYAPLTLQSSTLRLLGSNATGITVDASGNVGIGTSVPSDYNAAADNLVVGTTSGNNGITIASGSADQGSLFFADGTASGAEEAAGFLAYVHSSNAMLFGTSNTERARIDADGLKFNGETAAANALDDYEEGTWTPAFSQSGATISYAQQVGFYTKIGRLVHVSGRVETLSWSGGSGGISISGLPFSSITTSPTTDAHTASIGVTFFGWSSTNAPRTGFMASGATAIRLYTSDSSDARSQMDTEVTSVGDGSVGLLFNLVYTST